MYRWILVYEFWVYQVFRCQKFQTFATPKKLSGLWVSCLKNDVSKKSTEPYPNSTKRLLVGFARTSLKIL